MTVGLSARQDGNVFDNEKIRHKTKHKIHARTSGGSYSAYSDYCRGGLFFRSPEPFLLRQQAPARQERKLFSDVNSVIVLLESDRHSDRSVAVRAVIFAAEILV